MVLRWRLNEFENYECLYETKSITYKLIMTERYIVIEKIIEKDYQHIGIFRITKTTNLKALLRWVHEK